MKKKYIILLSIITLIIINVLVGFIFNWDTALAPWKFINNQILGFSWFHDLLHKLILPIGGETTNIVLKRTIIFFVYDFVKISFLLCTLIFLISYIQSYFPPERTKQIIGKYKGIKANFIGATLGTVTPFCSCSSIPIFMGFTRAGLSSGVTFSFLISSPLVDLGSLVLLASFFGVKVALAYVVVGIILAVVCGTLIEKTGLGNNIEPFVTNGKNQAALSVVQPTFKERLIYAKSQVSFTYKKVFWFLIIGIIIGSLIHNVIPENWVLALLGSDKWYSVFVSTFVGIPMYADIFGTIPIAEALLSKGVGLGTILAFMMSVTALSTPSLIMLRKVVKPKLLLAFICIITVGILLIGFLFNSFGYLFI